MTPRHATVMAEYNAWMNRRLYDAAATLPHEVIARDSGAFFGSLLATLNHIAVADTIWLRRFANAGPDAVLADALAAHPALMSLTQPLADTLPALRTYRLELDGIISDWSSRLTQDRLDAALDYASMAGQRQRRSYGTVILHFFNHQTHHRGQASTLLFQAGVDVGVTDLVAMIPNEA